MAEERKGKAKPRALTSDEDLELWRGIARTAKPLRKRKDRKAPVESEPAKDDTPKAAKTSKTVPPSPRPLPRREPVRPAAEPALASGVSAGLDRRTADRLKRGKLPIEGRLDLHGMTQAEAQRAVTGFIADGQRAGRRCLLVITGKGAGREGGVLRQGLPGWLNEPVNRSRLIAFTAAQPRDGGHGAMYLLLKKARD